MAEQTTGEKRVRTDFNTEGSDAVHRFKNDSARLIDLVEEMKDKDPRLAALAQTHYEIAAMFAVKLATS